MSNYNIDKLERAAIVVAGAIAGGIGIIVGKVCFDVKATRKNSEEALKKENGK